MITGNSSTVLSSLVSRVSSGSMELKRAADRMAQGTTGTENTRLADSYNSHHDGRPGSGTGTMAGGLAAGGTVAMRQSLCLAMALAKEPLS